MPEERGREGEEAEEGGWLENDDEDEDGRKEGRARTFPPKKFPVDEGRFLSGAEPESAKKEPVIRLVRLKTKQ